MSLRPASKRSRADPSRTRRNSQNEPRFHPRCQRCLTSSVCAGRMCQESLTRHRAGERRHGDVVSREECLDLIRVDRPGVWPVLLAGRPVSSRAGRTSMAEHSSLSSRSSSSSKSSCTSRLPSSRRETRGHRRTSAKILIDLKATRTAFYVLFGGALLSIFTMHFRVTVWMHVAVRALLNRGCRAREVRQADRPLPARALTWVAARFVTAFVTCASTTRR